MLGNKWEAKLGQLTKEQQQIAVVVDKTNDLEMLLKRIIGICLSPGDKKKREMLENALLHSSVVELGKKIRIFFVLCDFERITIDNKTKDVFHRVIALRNAFAHNDTSRIYSTIERKQGEKFAKIVNEFMMLEEQVGSSGKLKRQKRDEAFDEFNNKYIIVESKLKEIADFLEKKYKITDNPIKLVDITL